MKTKRLRIGIIGTGGNAKSHIASYLKQPDVEIAAVADLITEKAEQFLKEFDVNARVFADYKEMIDTMELDAVSVCTYNTTHKECTVYALEHEVPVLLEKPMSVTLGEALEICRAEKKSGKIVCGGFQPRFDANMQMIKKIVESGRLGHVYYVQTGGGRRHGIPVYKTESFIEKEKAGFGAVGDIGCYAIDLAMNAIGNPKPLTVSGTMTSHFGKTLEAYAQYDDEKAKRCAEKFNVDDFASAYIRLEGGVVLDFRIAWYMHLDSPCDTVFMGTKGSLRIPSANCWNGTFDKPMILYYDKDGEPVQEEIPLLKTEGGTLFDHKIRSFLDAVICDGPSPIPLSQMLYNQAIIDGIVRSSEAGHEVRIEIPEII